MGQVVMVTVTVLRGFASGHGRQAGALSRCPAHLLLRRERERERQRETERDRDRDRETETETDRQTDRQTDTERDTHRERQRETDRQTDRQTEAGDISLLNVNAIGVIVDRSPLSVQMVDSPDVQVVGRYSRCLGGR